MYLSLTFYLLNTSFHFYTQVTLRYSSTFEELNFISSFRVVQSLQNYFDLVAFTFSLHLLLMGVIDFSKRESKEKRETYVPHHVSL